jgi:hypothetical protein
MCNEMVVLRICISHFEPLKEECADMTYGIIEDQTEVTFKTTKNSQKLIKILSDKL